jgi:hypothetical protein
VANESEFRHFKAICEIDIGETAFAPCYSLKCVTYAIVRIAFILAKEKQTENKRKVNVAMGAVNRSCSALPRNAGYGNSSV